MTKEEAITTLNNMSENNSYIPDNFVNSNLLLQKGEFNLKISHNTNKTSVSYEQNNAMTNISWGDAKSVIAQTDLLGKTMTLYKKDTTPPEFMIVID